MKMIQELYICYKVCLDFELHFTVTSMKKMTM